eukprot:jgi/Botrbrau1/5412/Bobra.182_1s0016.1
MPPMPLGLEPTRPSGSGLQHVCPQGFQADMSVRDQIPSSRRCLRLKGGLAGLICHSCHPRELSTCGGPPNHGHSGRTHQVAAWWEIWKSRKGCCSG